MLIVGSFAVLLLVAAIGIPALLATVHALDRQQQRSDPSATATNAALVGALDEETSVRGYIITANQSFLAQYSSGAQRVTAALATLRGPDAENDIQSAVDVMEKSLKTWRSTFAEPVILHIRTGDPAAARAIVQSGVGKSRFDEFRAAHDQLEAQVAHDVSTSRKRLRHDVESSLLGLIVALAVGLAVAVGLWLWWRVWGEREAGRELALADLGVLLRSVVEATTEPIFAKDADGRHLLANRARAASLAHGDADAIVIGRTVDDFVDPEMARQIRAEDLRVMSTGEDSRNEEILGQPDGPHVFLTSKSPLEASDGRRIGVVGVARDVTLERLLQADRERLYQIEHRLAETLQQAMLGNAEIDDDRLDVCARYQPALEELTVGGDWYDVVPLPNDMVGLIVGDAVGRGIDAATAMGQLRSSLTALALAGLDPADALEAVEAFAHTIPGARSATCLYLIVDPTNARLVYSVAGHMPPLVITPDGDTEYLDRQQDPPLAAAYLDRPRRVGTHPFLAGSTLVLFTDGLVERRRESIDDGLERLALAASATIDLPIRAMCDGLIAGLLADQLQRDDVAVVVARLVKTHSDQFRRRVSANAANARVVRHDFQSWIAHYELGGEAAGDLAIALGEALANGVEHAYAGMPPGILEVEATYADGLLHVSVRDHGAWRAPQEEPTDRGRGLNLMRQLVDDVRVRSDARGTVVELDYHFPSRSNRT